MTEGIVYLCTLRLGCEVGMWEEAQFGGEDGDCQYLEVLVGHSSGNVWRALR